MGRAAAECLAGEGARVAVLARGRAGARRHRRGAAPRRESRRGRHLHRSHGARRRRRRVRATRGTLGRVQRVGERGRTGRGRDPPVRRPRRRRMDGDLRHRHAQRGALCARRAAAAARRGVGADRERVRALDQATVAGSRRVHRVEGRADEPLQEPLVVARARRHPREHRVARIVPVGRDARRTCARSRPNAASIPTASRTRCA